MNFTESDEDILLLAILSESSESASKFLYSDHWYNSIKKLNSRHFFDSFRMSKNCFNILFETLIMREEKPKDLKKKLLIFIFFISHHSTYRKIREIFGVPKSTACIIVEEMASFLYQMAKQEIKLPQNRNELEELKNGMSAKFSATNAVLVIDGTHIQVTSQSSDTFCFYNRKGQFSLNYVCIVDYKYRIRGLTYGFGSMHDSRIYNISQMKRKLDLLLNDTEFFIVGDSAFKGMSNIKSTNQNPISEEELNLLIKIRVIVENAFGMFKMKFKRFNYRIFNGTSLKSHKILCSSFFIHNFIIENEINRPFD